MHAVCAWLGLGLGLAPVMALVHPMIARHNWYACSSHCRLGLALVACMAGNSLFLPSQLDENGQMLKIARQTEPRACSQRWVFLHPCQVSMPAERRRCVRMLRLIRFKRGVPMAWIADAGGPTNFTPARPQASANCAFSERNPYPGCIMVAPQAWATCTVCQSQRKSCRAESNCRKGKGGACKGVLTCSMRPP